ncbi:Replicative DNA helicase [compost metagenome]
MQAGKVVIITARPSMGKTTFVTNIIKHLISNTEKRVLACPLETGSANLMDYLVVQDCNENKLGITIKDVMARMGNMDIVQKHKINKSIDRILDTDRLEIADTRDLTLTRLGGILQNSEHDICFLDLFEKLADVTEENLSQKLEEAQIIAQKTGTCLVLVTQLRRTGQKVSKKPDLEQIKNSGKYEEVGDLIIGLYREYYYNKDVEDIIEIMILKQRNGLRNYSAGYEFLGSIGKIGEYKEVDDGGW